MVQLTKFDISPVNNIPKLRHIPEVDKKIIFEIGKFANMIYQYISDNNIEVSPERPIEKYLDDNFGFGVYKMGSSYYVNFIIRYDGGYRQFLNFYYTEFVPSRQIYPNYFVHDEEDGFMQLELYKGSSLFKLTNMTEEWEPVIVDGVDGYDSNLEAILFQKSLIFNLNFDHNDIKNSLKLLSACDVSYLKIRIRYKTRPEIFESFLEVLSSQIPNLLQDKNLEKHFVDVIGDLKFRDS